MTKEQARAWSSAVTVVEDLLSVFPIADQASELKFSHASNEALQAA